MASAYDLLTAGYQHPIADLARQIHGAGLEVLIVAGQRPGAVLDDHVDESLHHKAVSVVGHPSTSS